ncbi:MAG: hypothetical protein LBM01_02200 [Christensenellaceae bacterium]|jgi:hypothetical protein|nr:hypothetical protein [Christensenellaceae bacterium]
MEFKNDCVVKTLFSVADKLDDYLIDIEYKTKHIAYQSFGREESALDVCERIVAQAVKRDMVRGAKVKFLELLKTLSAADREIILAFTSAKNPKQKKVLEMAEKFGYSRSGFYRKIAKIYETLGKKLEKIGITEQFWTSLLGASKFFRDSYRYMVEVVCNVA